MSKFIVIEGLIGVGKTSLCKLLQKQWDAKLVLEPCEQNPFLANFYADPQHYAFPAQMFYLASRYHQQMNLLQNELFHDIIVSDYLFEKDRIFAEQTLNAEELDLYNKFTSLLNHHVAKPAFILFLDAPTNIIMNRIKKRSISAEQVIEAEYLNQLRDRYYKLWNSWTHCPIYVLDTTEINYVDNENDAQYIIKLIKAWLDNKPLKKAPQPYTHVTPQLSLFKYFPNSHKQIHIKY